MPRALLSVSDKRGIVQFAQGLVQMGWDIISTGGTAAALKAAGVPVQSVESTTKFPEMLDGRVKTLHPMVHGALLGRRDNPVHLRAMEEHGITPIDLVAVNLYPFRATISQPDVSFEDAIENIDIGGPSMLRSAAKNHEFVLPVVEPSDYAEVLALLRADQLSPEIRQSYAAKVFAHTADYDSAIAGYLTPREEGLPARQSGSLERIASLRYGENPQQRAALYATEEPRGIRDLSQRQGKELSFNNILDLDGAMAAITPWNNRPACAVVKHTTPCGIAVASSALEAWHKAVATDPQSAFGGVVAFNTVVDRATAEELVTMFLEVIVAPSFHDEALRVLGTKKNLRVIELPVSHGEPGLDYKNVRGGFLVQDRFQFDRSEEGWRVPTVRHPTEAEWSDLRFGWAAVASVKSNAIMLVRNEAAIGIGAGQMSRVDASFLAVHKARQQGHEPRGSVLASDGFFPFPDGVEAAAEAGITAIIQPGGSVKDDDVIAVADRLGVAMVLTGSRQFRH